MDFQSRISSFLQGAKRGANDFFQKQVAPVQQTVARTVQQAPAQIQPFGQRLLQAVQSNAAQASARPIATPTPIIPQAFNAIQRTAQPFVDRVAQARIPTQTYGLAMPAISPITTPLSLIKRNTTPAEAFTAAREATRTIAEPYIGAAATALKKPSLDVPLLGPVSDLQTQTADLSNTFQGFGAPTGVSDSASKGLIALSFLPASKGLKGTAPAVDRAVKLLRNKITKDDVALIGRFAEIVEMKGPKANLGEIGPQIQSLATNVFGKDGANLTNSQLKNAFDLVLGKIGTKPNSAGLGLSVGTVRDIPRSIDAPKQVGAFEQLWNRSRNIIEKQGPSGQRLAGLIREARDVAETTAGGWVSRLPTVRALKGKDFENFVDVAEGKAAPLNEKVAAAASEWGQIRAEVYETAKQAGLDIGKIENYFPHTYDESLFKGDNYKKAIRELMQSGQAATELDAAKILRHAQDVIRNRRHGNLELERLVNLPGYQKTPDALFGYLESAANRVAQVQRFGKDDAAALQLINGIAEEGGDASTARSLFDIAAGATKYGELQTKVSGALRTYNTVTKLGLGAVTNVGQNVNTATVVGALRTLKNAPGALKKENRDFALKAGITLDGVIRDLREGSGFSGKVLGKLSAPGFNQVEKFNRTLSAIAGRDYAIDLAKKAASGSSSARSALAKIGLDTDAIVKRGGALSESEQITAARNIVERTQFKVDPQDLPGWASSPWGRVIAQFRSFGYNQSAFIGREIVQPALSGDVKPLVRFLATALPAGAAIKETRNFLQNRDSEENPAKRVQQYYSQAGGLGLAGDVVTGLFPQNGKYLPQDRAVTLALGTVGGPTVGTIADAYGSVSQAVQGKPDSLKRFALRQVPIAGSTLQNTVMPYKSKSPEPASPGTESPDQLASSVRADGVVTPVEKATVQAAISDLNAQQKKILANNGINLPFLGQQGGLTVDQKNEQLGQLEQQEQKLKESLQKPKTDYLKVPLTGDVTVDREILKKRSSAITSQITALTEQVLAGQLSATEAGQRIQQLQALQQEAQKATAKPRTTKARTAKAASFKAPKVSKARIKALKFKAPKAVKLKTIKGKSIKRPRL